MDTPFRITRLEEKYDSLCGSVNELHDTVVNLRDNHVAHLQESIDDLRNEVSRSSYTSTQTATHGDWLMFVTKTVISFVIVGVVGAVIFHFLPR